VTASKAPPQYLTRDAYTAVAIVERGRRRQPG